MTVEVSDPTILPLQGSVSDASGIAVPFLGLLELLAVVQSHADRAVRCRDHA